MLPPPSFLSSSFKRNAGLDREAVGGAGEPRGAPVQVGSGCCGSRAGAGQGAG